MCYRWQDRTSSTLMAGLFMCIDDFISRFIRSRAVCSVFDRYGKLLLLMS
jgi:hypothetical protein